YSVHNVAASLVETEAWDFAAVYFHFLDWVMHDFEKFLAPAAADAPLAAVARYGQVVESACRLQDALLADLLRAAGPGARVFLVSDHGYLTGAQRPDTPAVPAGIAVHHRPMGIFAAAGPGLRRGAHLGTASLLDVAPTLLHAMGLPVGEDMDGKVLAECFEQPAPIARVASWDVLAPPPTMPPVDDSAVLLQRFVELGYVDASALSDPAAAQAQRTVNGWNLGMDLLDAGQAEAALPYLEAASWRNPEISHYAFWLAKCQAKLGLAKLADESVEVLRDYGENDARVRLLLAQLALDLEQPAAALEHVTAAAALGNPSPGLATLRALALASKGEWPEAFALLREQVVTCPTTETWLGLARCYLQNRQWADAEAAARQTLACNPRLAAAHLCLARALARQKKKDEAWASLSEACRLAPNWPPVRQAIAKFFPERVPSLGVETRRAAGPTLLAQARARRAAYDAELLQLRASQKPLAVVPEPPAPGSSGKTFVIVSGLPRSGTSLMMQMLQAGGLAPMADQVRGPNEHNPRGFFEWEAVKQLPREPHCLEQAEGRAIKVVSALVPYLPRRHRYKIIAMTRDAGEIARSQEKMLGLAAAGALPPEKIERHQRSWLQSLAKAANFSVLELNYGDVIAAASAASSRIAEFLGPALLPHPERMASAVDSALYRNRAESVLRS
ncbi:MAG TPA: tetratricopeptide repeat protein, partial [Opitutales bacterium]|nr:tetratricopeptide repeat protein [Opitutales bacterium]